MSLRTKLAAGFMLGIVALGAVTPPVEATGIQALDHLVTTRYIPGKAGAAVLVKRGRQVLLCKAYGQANLELNMRMRADYVFRIGSVTKTFGAVVVLQLVDEGKLALDSTISTYLKDAPTSWANVTLAHLLSHTSGIPSYNSGPQGGYAVLRSKRRSLDEVIASFKDLPLEFEPGSAFTYSNSGFLLLEKIIEVTTGRGFFENLATRITTPLGMTFTGGGDADALVPGLVTGYTDSGHPTFPAPVDISFMAGGMVSTVGDLAKFTEALHEGRLLRPATYRRMTTRYRTTDGHETEYGLGLWIRKSQGHTLYGHGGDVVGFSAEVEADPMAHTLVVILQNEDKFGAHHAVNVEYLSRRLLALAAGKPIPEPKAVNLTAEQLAQVVGSYASSQGRRVISLEQGELISRFNGSRPYRLKATSPTTFFDPQSELRLRFVIEHGRAVACQKFEDQGDEGPLAHRLAGPVLREN